jgi:hypothetical protein
MLLGGKEEVMDRSQKAALGARITQGKHIMHFRD